MKTGGISRRSQNPRMSGDSEQPVLKKAPAEEKKHLLRENRLISHRKFSRICQKSTISGELHRAAGLLVSCAATTPRFSSFFRHAVASKAQPAFREVLSADRYSFAVNQHEFISFYCLNSRQIFSKAGRILYSLYKGCYGEGQVSSTSQSILAMLL